MGRLVLTAELMLKLQQVIDEVGLTKVELNRLFDSETLSIILPFLLGRSKLSPYCSFTVWQEIKLNNQIRTGVDLVSALQGIGVRMGLFSYLPVEALQAPKPDGEAYELFCVTLGELGLGNKANYKTIEKRARILEIHDGTAPPTLAVELLLGGIIKASKKRFRYRVFSQPSPASGILGEVVFAIENGFPPEEQAGRSFDKEDPVFISVPYNFDDDVIDSEQKLIFARRKEGPLGHEPRPPRAGMWPIGPTGGRLLSRR